MQILNLLLVFGLEEALRDQINATVHFVDIGGQESIRPSCAGRLNIALRNTRTLQAR